MSKNSGNFKKIPLKGKNGAGKFAIVSEEDYKQLSKHSWRLQVDTKTPRLRYACTSINGKNTHVYMHRMIAGDKEGTYVDHKNRDTLDNRRDNLRHISPSESAFNRSSFGNSLKGTTRVGKKWQAQAHGEYLGLYDTEQEAHEAYLEHRAKQTE